MDSAASYQALPRERHWHKLVELLVPLALGFTPFLWFPSPYIANGNDLSWAYNAAEWAHSRLFMWLPRDNGGIDNGAGVAGLLWHELEAVVQALPGSHTFHEKFFLTILFTVTAFSIWTSMRILTRSRASSLVGTIVYLFNPVMITGALYENVSVSNICLYATLPTLITLLILTLERRLPILLGAPLFGIVSLVASPLGMLPPLQVALLIFTVTIVFVAWLTDKGPDPTRHVFLVCATFLGAFILINAYWIFPLAEHIKNLAQEAGGSSLSDFAFADWESGQSSHSSLYLVARMLGSWDWFYQFNNESYVSYAATYLRNPIFIGIGAAIAAASFSLIRFARNREARARGLMFSAAAIVVLFCAPGSHPPTGFIFDFLRRHVPGLVVIRSPWFMFAQFLPLVYGVMLGLLLKSLADGWKRYSLAALLCVSAVVYGYPLLTGDFLKPFRQQNPGFVVKYPAYVEDASRYIASRPGRYTFFPAFSNSPSAFAWQGSPMTSASPVTGFMTDRPMAWNAPGGAASLSRRPFDLLLQRTYRDILDENSDARADLQALGISDIILQNDAWFDFGGGYQIAPGVWEEAVAKIPGIRKGPEFGPWHMYGLDYRGAVRANGTVAIGNVRPILAGAWGALGNPDIPLLSLDSDVAIPAGVFKLPHQYVVDPSAASALNLLRFWSANTNSPLVIISDGISNGVPLPPAFAARISRTAYSRSANRGPTQPLFNLGTWAARPPQPGEAKAPLTSRVVDVGTVHASILPSSVDQALLVIHNDGSAPVKLTVRFSGEALAPDLASPGVVSWNAASSLMTLTAPPGAVSRAFGHRPGPLGVTVVAVSANESRPPALAPFSLRSTPESTLVVLKPRASRTGTGSIGTMLPILKDVSADAAPMIYADVAPTSGAGAYESLVVEVRRPDGRISSEEFPADAAHPLNVTSDIDQRYSQRWEFLREEHPYDQSWKMEHRIPDRVEGSTISVWLLLAGSTRPGVAPPAFIIRTLSAVALTSYAPASNVVTANLGPESAAWSGETANAELPVTRENATIYLGAQPVADFADYRPGLPKTFVPHERYNFTTVNNEQFNAEVLWATKSALNVKLDNGSARQFQASAIAAIAPPPEGGLITISRAIPPAASNARELTFSFTPSAEEQRVFVQLKLSQGARSAMIPVDPYDPDAHFQGISLADAPDLTALTSGSVLARQSIGASDTRKGPPGKNLTIDLQQLFVAHRLPPAMHLERITFTITWASRGIVLSPVALYSPSTLALRSTGAGDATVSYSATGMQVSRPIPATSHYVNPTRYDITMSPPAAAVLSLDQAFNSGWAAVIVGVIPSTAGFTSFGNLELALKPTLPHFPVNGTQNGWLVPAGKNLHVILFYAPQQVYALSMGITLVGVIVLLIVGTLAYRKYRREVRPSLS